MPADRAAGEFGNAYRGGRSTAAQDVTGCMPRRNGGRVITSAGSSAVDGYEPVDVQDRAVAEQCSTAMFRRRSAQPSRRAVLHVRAAGDAAVPSDVAAWYTERAFHFYVAGLRLRDRAAQAPHSRILAGRAGRAGAAALAAAFADLDAACAHLREAEGMTTVIVTAQGRAALAAALWRDSRTSATADALVLCAPELPARSCLALDIDCPVLVLSAAGGAARAGLEPGSRAASRSRSARRKHGLGPAAPAGLQLGGHVTWLRLPAEDLADWQSDGPGRQQFFDQLGRWLGAYMYGQLRDQLL